MEINKTALTHGGKFHADDVFASALLTMLRPDIEIKRGFTVPERFDGLVFDLGLGKFDHHQQGSPVRENGVPYAAFGLLWRELGASLAGGEKEAARFDQSFVQPLDLDDNTGCGNPIADVIGSFNPVWDSSDAPDKCFQKAVAFAAEILRRQMDMLKASGRARALVQEALSKMEDKIVILPCYAPWKSVLVPSEAEFVVYPSQRGGFCAQGVPADAESNRLKCAFPQEWGGKPAAELSARTGIATLGFCHNNLFLISAGTREDAVRACQAARKPQG